MEFGGVLGLDGLLGSSSDHNHSVGGGGPCLFSMDNGTLTTELPMKQRSLFGGFLKHGRSASAGGQEQQVDWRSLKLARTARSTTTTTTEQMLSFSTSASKPEQYASLYPFNSHDGYHSHYYPYSSSSSSASAAHSSFRSTAGLGCGSRYVSSSHGPFTPSQWMELEHQALIYKYMDANIPVPSSLLVPFRRSTNPSPLSPFLSGSTPLGWGPFHLGLSGNGDAEPGRCRRSDGKKWRCSRDVVADQKYCERHVNRGRHRSRKHVEGQSGQASKPVPTVAAPPRQPASAVSGSGIGGSSNNSTLRITMSQQTGSLMQPNEPSPPRNDRIQMSKENAKYHDRDSNGLSLLDDASLKRLDSLFPMSKRQNPFEATISRPEFGLISTESLGLNPLRTSYSDDDNDVGFHSASKLNIDRQPRQHHHHPLLHFIDDWPKAQSELPSLAWPKIDEMKSSDRRTQLSISIPSNISSSSVSPLRLSRGFNPTSRGNQPRGAGGWIPISREPTTIGGPLGEVLNNKTNTTPKRDSSSPSLNLFLTDGWDASPRLMQSSPTGVLQKSSSTGSSPRAEGREPQQGGRGIALPCMHASIRCTEN